jgi:hypothetical protein
MSPKSLGLVSILLLGFGFTAGCDLMVDSVLSKMEATTYEEMSKEMDSYSEELLTGKNEEGESAVPATQFFADQKYANAIVYDRTLAKGFCEKVVLAGAPAAHAVVHTDEEGHFISGFLVTMPADKSVRTKVIECHNQYWKDIAKSPRPEGEEPYDFDDELVDFLAKEVGQKYLFVPEP